MPKVDNGNWETLTSPWINDVDLTAFGNSAVRSRPQNESDLDSLESPFLALTEDSLNHPAETDYPVENEFQLKRLPPKAQSLFGQGSGSWRAAVAEAIGAGIRDPNDLADLVFFMHHPERMAAGIGRLIDQKEPNFVKLRAEWNQHRNIVTGILKVPSTTKTPTTVACAVFLPANPSKNYEDYVAAPTTGRMTLMINGRDSGGKGPHTDQHEAFDNMQARGRIAGGQ